MRHVHARMFGGTVVARPSRPASEAALREYLLAEAVEFRRLMVETLLDDLEWAKFAWFETSKPVDRLASGGEHSFTRLATPRQPSRTRRRRDTRHPGARRRRAAACRVDHFRVRSSAMFGTVAPSGSVSSASTSPSAAPAPAGIDDGSTTGSARAVDVNVGVEVDVHIGTPHRDRNRHIRVDAHIRRCPGFALEGLGVPVHPHPATVLGPAHRRCAQFDQRTNTRADTAITTYRRLLDRSLKVTRVPIAVLQSGQPCVNRSMASTSAASISRTHSVSQTNARRWAGISQPARRVVTPGGRYPHPPAVAHDWDLLGADPLADVEDPEPEPLRGLSEGRQLGAGGGHGDRGLFHVTSTAVAQRA